MKITGSNIRGDSLFGGSGKDHIYGNGGRDLISAWSAVGDAAADKIYAGAGDDLISGLSVDFGTLARSGSRGAFVNGGSGYDMLIIDSVTRSRETSLGKFDEVCKIVQVEEIIYNFQGLSARQTVFGSKAGETIYIGEGGSKVDGGKGNDYLFAGTGNDILKGGAGNDFLSAAGGRNTLTGGAGADYFQFRLTEDYSYSNITDFQKGVDKIALVLDTGDKFKTKTFGDGLREIDRPLDEVGYLDYDHGRIIGRKDFRNITEIYNDNVIYEQKTGSFIYHFVRASDGKEFDILLAHLDDRPKLTADDFVFMIV